MSTLRQRILSNVVIEWWRPDLLGQVAPQALPDNLCGALEKSQGARRRVHPDLLSDAQPYALLGDFARRYRAACSGSKIE